MGAVVRPDMFVTIHKGIRAMLFELSVDAGRLDPTSIEQIDALAARLERDLGFLEEHAEHEDRHVLPALRTVAPELAERLAADHRSLDAVQGEVQATALALGTAQADERPALALALARKIDLLVSLELAHMGREESEANAAFWRALDDEELLAIRGRIVTSIPTARYLEWMKLVLPAASPAERSALSGGGAARVE